MKGFLKAVLAGGLTTILVLRCVRPEHRVDFDINRNAIVSCDSSVIRRVIVSEKTASNVVRIILDKNSDGSNVIYLDKPNSGYYCNAVYPIKLKPNEAYTLYSVSMDSGFELTFFTNGRGEVDSVYNRVGCTGIY